MSDPFTRYAVDPGRPSSTGLSDATAAMRWHFLPATDPSMPLDHLVVARVNSTAKWRYDGEFTEKRAGAILMATGIVNAQAIPIVPTTSLHTELSAVVQRAIRPTMKDLGVFDAKLHKRYCNWVRKNYDIIFPSVRNNVQHAPGDFAYWNARGHWAEHARKLHESDFESLMRNGLGPHELAHNTFAKRELSVKTTIDGVAGFKPRAITANTGPANAFLAPWARKYHKAIATVWGRDSPVTYNTGYTSTEIGSIADRLADQHLAYIECDGSGFDSSVLPEDHRLLISLHRLAGCGDTYAKVETMAINVSSRTRFGIKYSVKGTVTSGRPTTSVDNTILVVTKALFVLTELTRLPLPELLKRVKILGAGDDSLVALPRGLLPTVSQYTAMHRALSIEAEAVLHTGANALYHATFCSARFYPCEVDGVASHILLSRLGRVVSKFGYYCDPPPSVAMPDTALALLRADCTSRARDYQLPFYRVLLKHQQRVSAGAKFQRIPDYYLRHRREHQTTSSVVPDSRTWAVMHAVYMLGPSEEQNLDKLLTQAKPRSWYTSSCLRRVLAIDEMMSGDNDVRADDVPAFSTALEPWVTTAYQPPNLDEVSCDLSSVLWTRM